MKPESVRLSWKRLPSFIQARAEFASVPCVYAQADSRGRPVRVGKAARGLVARYRGGTGYALDAAAHDSGNVWFVAAAPFRLCTLIEQNLIWACRVSLPYNNQGKQHPPRRWLRLTHSGAVPVFPKRPS